MILPCSILHRQVQRALLHFEGRDFAPADFLKMRFQLNLNGGPIVDFKRRFQQGLGQAIYESLAIGCRRMGGVEAQLFSGMRGQCTRGLFGGS